MYKTNFIFLFLIIEKDTIFLLGWRQCHWRWNLITPLGNSCIHNHIIYFYNLTSIREAFFNKSKELLIAILKLFNIFAIFTRFSLWIITTNVIYLIISSIAMVIISESIWHHLFIDCIEWTFRNNQRSGCISMSLLSIQISKRLSFTNLELSPRPNLM